MEEHRFRSFFGAQNEIMLKVWSMLGGGAACTPRIASPSICLGLSIFEGLSKGRPRILCCWWV
jgi:hypothetical protein